KTSAHPLECLLLACWEAGHDEPWLLLTDLAACAANPCWYAYRAWIEQGFKVAKSGGWQWQATRMTDPGRVERPWRGPARGGVSSVTGWPSPWRRCGWWRWPGRRTRAWPWRR